MSQGLITLTTDFGGSDGYVAAMKGVILSRCPEVGLIDVTHQIPAGGIAVGAYVLRQATVFFPEGTIHLAVVDPGVGSRRRAIACEAGGHLYVAPDNGLLGATLEVCSPTRVHAITRAELWRPEPSPVFHGRDILGPVAAHLASGGALSEVGEPIDPRGLVRSAWPPPELGQARWSGQVIHVDAFGNLVTNLPLGAGPAREGTVEVGARRFRLARTYSDVPEGKLVALVGSTGLIEIACNSGSAARILGAEPGQPVVFHIQDPP